MMLFALWNWYGRFFSQKILFFEVPLYEQENLSLKIAVRGVNASFPLLLIYTHVMQKNSSRHTAKVSREVIFSFALGVSFLIPLHSAVFPLMFECITHIYVSRKLHSHVQNNLEINTLQL